MQSFTSLVLSVSILGPVSLLLPFLFLFHPRKENGAHCSQQCFSCLCFKPSEVSETYHP